MTVSPIVANFERDVHPGDGVDGDGDFLLLEAFEALLLGLQAVHARRQVREGEVPPSVGHRLAGEAPVGAGDDQGCARKRAAGRILDVAHNRSVEHLRGAAPGDQKDEHHKRQPETPLRRLPPVCTCRPCRTSRVS